MNIERTKKNYKVKLVFLDEDDKEVFNANTNTNLIEEMYGIGVVGLQELYNSAVKSFNDIKTPEELLEDKVVSELASIEKSKAEKPLEDSFITTDAEEWLNKVTEIRTKYKTLKYLRTTNSDLFSDELNYDYEIIKNAKLYTVNPVFSYKGKVITCDTCKYDTIDGLKDFLKDKQYALYCIQQRLAIEIPKPESNSLPLDPFLERPKATYVFRGAILDEN